jgi:hypothetical protein
MVFTIPQFCKFAHVLWQPHRMHAFGEVLIGTQFSNHHQPDACFAK